MSVYRFTSESVGEGHPDKIADQISDAVLDACLQDDPDARVGCETFVTSNMIVVGGEITTTAHIDTTAIAHAVLKDIGYNKETLGLDYHHVDIVHAVNPQSSDIDGGIRGGYEQSQHSIGAGDQGIMFGYACNESPELMPTAIMMAHTIMRRAAQIRKEQQIEWLGPDCKCQVTITYDGNTPQGIDTVVLSHQHSADVHTKQLTAFLTDKIIEPVIATSGLNRNDCTILINPSGRFVVGGPQADAGLTGRKIISDTYGGASRHGGGAFSGKDASKVDRSAAYMARKVAKHVVAAQLATHCELQLSYAIGVPKPISITLYTFGTERIALPTIERAIHTVFRFNPTDILNELALKRPIYRPTAVYGHFGRPEFPWEICDKVDELIAAASEP